MPRIPVDCAMPLTLSKSDLWFFKLCDIFHDRLVSKGFKHVFDSLHEFVADEFCITSSKYFLGPARTLHIQYGSLSVRHKLDVDYVQTVRIGGKSFVWNNFQTNWRKLFANVEVEQMKLIRRETPQYLTFYRSIKVGILFIKNHSNKQTVSVLQFAFSQNVSKLCNNQRLIFDPRIKIYVHDLSIYHLKTLLFLVWKELGPDVNLEAIRKNYFQRLMAHCIDEGLANYFDSTGVNVFHGLDLKTVLIGMILMVKRLAECV